MATFADVPITDQDLLDGFSAAEIFSRTEGLGITFDDLITLPGAIDFGVHEVDLTSRISKNHKLNLPLCSSPMDTVTEHEMAIHMALQGGIGFIHCNCSAEEQAAMIRKVKTYENGFILEPAVLAPHDSLHDLDALYETRKISGVPITSDGTMGSKLVGLVTQRDCDFIRDRSKLLSEVMTPLDKLVTGKYPLPITTANKILKVSRCTSRFCSFK
jgi:IMP dehydrogenase